MNSAHNRLLVMLVFFFGMVALQFSEARESNKNKASCKGFCLEKKALLGDGKAALTLADDLLYGDRALMKDWYRISAENGNVDGQYNYAHFLAVDSKKAKDCYRSIYWFDQAAKQGDKLSMKKRDSLKNAISIGADFRNGCLKNYMKGA